MKVHVTASTGVTVVVWSENELFHARPSDTMLDPQVCLGVDLFEVIAELAGLDLEVKEQAVEALELAETARADLLASENEDYDDELSVDGVP